MAALAHHKVGWVRSGDDARLLVLAPLHTRREIAEKLGRTYDAVRARCRHLGVNCTENGRGVLRGHRVRPWAERDDLFLRTWSELQAVSWIAKRLGRTPRAVERRAGGLGLSFRNTAGWSLRSISDWLGYDRQTVKQAAVRLGQHWRRKRGTLHFVISDEQREALRDYFVSGYVAGRSLLPVNRART